MYNLEQMLQLFFTQQSVWCVNRQRLYSFSFHSFNHGRKTAL